MKKKLFIMCGIPGCGKSTYIKEQLEKYGGTWVSRDVIRFSKLKFDDSYFEHENEVFQEFISQIQSAIDNNYSENIYVDATNLNKKSRKKLFDKLNFNKDKIALVGVNFDVPIEICLKRNSKREGRKRVPDSAIYEMANRLEPITFDENFSEIINITGGKK